MNRFLALAILLPPVLFSGCSSMSESMERSMLFHPVRNISLTPQMAGMEAKDVFIISGGKKIHGWLFGMGEERLTVIYLHGNAENVSNMLGIVKALEPMEFDLLLVDYRGYGRSEGEPSVDGIVEDTLAAVDWIVSQQGVPAKRIVLWGRSLGAAAALQTAMKRPDLGGVIVESGFASLRKIAAYHMPWIPSFMVRDKLDSVLAISQLNMPKLIIHGERDQVIPYTQGVDIFQAAPSPKEFYPVAGAGHNDIKAKGGAGYIQKIKAWLARL
ncbi:MAG: alpha/beta hydrolase [Nitrospinota bacterium]|nr:alpha/beta hydrolase [Nitrospinota bacterium]